MNQTTFADYYNTVHESGATLRKSKAKADTQSQLILHYFQAYPNFSFTPYEISDAFPDYDLSSIKRSITDLTDSGHLVKSKTLVMERKGKKNHEWRCK